MEWLSIAEGGFVGARDRTARQIQKEQELLDWTRSEARALKATKQYGADRASFALALARRAFQDPQFEWAFEPAPRSYWRGSGASISAKVGYVLVVFCLWLAVVWPVGALLGGLIGVCAWFFGVPRSPLQPAIDASLLGAVREYPGRDSLDRARTFVVVLPDRAAGTVLPAGGTGWTVSIANSNGRRRRSHHRAPMCSAGSSACRWSWHSWRARWSSPSGPALS